MRALAPEVLFQVRKTLDEGHGFSRVPMSLRLTQGDENHLDSPIMILRGLEVVFDCAVNGMPLDGFSRGGTLFALRAKSCPFASELANQEPT